MKNFLENFSSNNCFPMVISVVFPCHLSALMLLNHCFLPLIRLFSSFHASKLS